jgi:hypothetical protein
MAGAGCAIGGIVELMYGFVVFTMVTGFSMYLALALAVNAGVALVMSVAIGFIVAVLAVGKT